MEGCLDTTVAAEGHGWEPRGVDTEQRGAHVLPRLWPTSTGPAPATRPL